MCLCSVFAMTCVCVFPTVAQKHFPRSTLPIKKLDSCWGCSRTRPSQCKRFFWKARGLVSLESIISGSATHRIHQFLHWIWRVSFRSTFKITKLLAIVDGNYPAQLLPNNVVKTLGGVWGEFWHWSNVSAPNGIGQKIQVFNREGWQRIFRIGETTWRSICAISNSSFGITRGGQSNKKHL